MDYTDLVTIMIATFNSEKLLPRTLDALKAQTYPAELMEILIIDGGSNDTTRDIAKKYDGSVEFMEENGKFIAEIWLKMVK